MFIANRILSEGNRNYIKHRVDNHVAAEIGENARLDRISDITRTSIYRFILSDHGFILPRNGLKPMSQGRCSPIINLINRVWSFFVIKCVDYTVAYYRQRHEPERIKNFLAKIETFTGSRYTLRGSDIERYMKKEQIVKGSNDHSRTRRIFDLCKCRVVHQAKLNKKGIIKKIRKYSEFTLFSDAEIKNLIQSVEKKKNTTLPENWNWSHFKPLIQSSN